MNLSPEHVRVIEGMLAKLPTFQVCWRLEVQQSWLRCFTAITDAIEMMGREDPLAAPETPKVTSVVDEAMRRFYSHEH